MTVESAALIGTGVMAVLGFAAQWGATRANLRGVRESVADMRLDLRGTLANFGERLGAVEQQASNLKAVMVDRDLRRAEEKTPIEGRRIR